MQCIPKVDLGNHSVMEVRDEGILYSGGSIGGGDKWSESGYILNLDGREFADG